MSVNLDLCGVCSDAIKSWRDVVRQVATDDGIEESTPKQSPAGASPVSSIRSRVPETVSIAHVGSHRTGSGRSLLRGFRCSLRCAPGPLALGYRELLAVRGWASRISASYQVVSRRSWG